MRLWRFSCFLNCSTSSTCGLSIRSSDTSRCPILIWDQVTLNELSELIFLFFCAHANFVLLEISLFLLPLHSFSGFFFSVLWFFVCLYSSLKFICFALETSLLLSSHFKVVLFGAFIIKKYKTVFIMQFQERCLQSCAFWRCIMKK